MPINSERAAPFVLCGDATSVVQTLTLQEIPTLAQVNWDDGQ